LASSHTYRAVASFSASLHQQQRSEIMSQLLVVVNSFFRSFRSSPQRLTSSKTTNHRTFQPATSTSSLLSLRRCRCERRDINDLLEDAQALCETILKTTHFPSIRPRDATGLLSIYRERTKG
ncbi:MULTISPECIES: hypothetical protein, partial [Pandoraea]|uniref:hypothetical protein n=1 Tax=Pandoraea TaxID=93217 RepID=UPI001F5D3A99